MEYTRDQGLEKIRAYLASQQRPDETTCQLAARLGIFCRGFDRWTVAELREHYPWLAKRLAANTPREEWLRAITAWDGARMLTDGLSVSCDLKGGDQEGCLGLERYESARLCALFPQLFAPHDVIRAR